MTFPMFKVGGCVRDELLRQKPKDIDLAVEAPSFEAMLAFVRERGCKVWAINEEYFTIRANDPIFGPVDVVLCRKDGVYKDGRRPESVEVGTIREDLARRDFTVNAMALKLDLSLPADEQNVIIDPYNGQKDLYNKVLRFVGDPKQRLGEDALRAFRAMRFSITKGFVCHPDTVAAVNGMSQHEFDGVHANRIRDELFLCFSHSTQKTLRAFREFPILEAMSMRAGINLQPTLGKIKKEQD